MALIRRAEQKDVDALLALLLQVNHVHAVIRPDLFRNHTTKYSREELPALLDREDTVIFVYEAEKRVLGYAFCMIQEAENSRLMQNIKTLYLDDLCVDQQARHQHIGEMLFRHVVEYARSQGCYHVTLNVWEGNDSAKAFYTHMGMNTLKTGMEVIL